MKITLMQVIVAGALLIGSQAQAAGFATMSGTGLQAGSAVTTCMGGNGHPDVGDRAVVPSCKVGGKDALRPMPRYNSVS